MHQTELSGLLQMAISPVILISACGLLLLSMTNRLGRAIDRIRAIHKEHRDAMDPQVRLLMTRARLIRSAILWTSLCMVGTSLLILVTFISTLAQKGALVVISALFIGSLVCMAVGLTYFIVDVFRALQATEMEVRKIG